MSFDGAWGFVQARAGNGHSLAARAMHPARICLARTKRARHGLRPQTWPGWLTIAIFVAALGRLSYRDRNGEHCDQLPEGCQIRRWLPFRLPLLNLVSKKIVGRTGFEPVTSSVSEQYARGARVLHSFSLLVTPCVNNASRYH